MDSVDLYDALPLNTTLYSAELQDSLRQCMKSLVDDGFTEPGQLEYSNIGMEPLPADAPPVIGIAGLPQSGKDVIADFLCDTYSGVGRMAYSDAILLEVNAWLVNQSLNHVIGPDNKNHYRTLLQNWGFGRKQENPDYWSGAVQQQVNRLHQSRRKLVVVAGTRIALTDEGFDYTDMKTIWNIDGEMWKVVRPANPYKADHNVEGGINHVPQWAWQACVNNDVENNLQAYYTSIEKVFTSSRGQNLSTSERETLDLISRGLI